MSHLIPTFPRIYIDCNINQGLFKYVYNSSHIPIHYTNSPINKNCSKSKIIIFFSLPSMPLNGLICRNIHRYIFTRKINYSFIYIYTSRICLHLASFATNSKHFKFTRKMCFQNRPNSHKF